MAKQGLVPDQLFIRSLAVSAIIGVLPQERLQSQALLLDVVFSVDAAAASRTDALAQTVDYSAVTQALKEYVVSTQFQLIETLADQAATFLQQRFQLSWLRLTVTKQPLDMPDVAGVGITIERRIANHL